MPHEMKNTPKTGKVRVILALFGALLCLTLGGCADRNSADVDGVASAVELDLRAGDSLRTGGVLSLVEGAAYEAELPAEVVVVPAAEKRQLALSGHKLLQIDSVSYCLAEGGRISAIYSNAASLGAGDCVQMDAKCLGSALDEATEQDALARVAEAFSLRQTGSSAVSIKPFLQPSSESTFTALYFYPRVVYIEGRVLDEDGSEVSEIVLLYPCVNLLGCLDGTYRVQAVDPNDD